MRRFFELIQQAQREKTLGYALRRRLYPLALFPWLSLSQVGKNITIHCPPYDRSSVADERRVAVAKRIFAAYGRMRQAEGTVASRYKPSSIWQTQLDDAYSSLIEGSLQNDLDKFHFFLANFGVWERYHGVENNLLIREATTSKIKACYLKYKFLRALKIWKWFYGNRRDVSALGYPQVGNQAGALIDGRFVGYGSFFNEIYGSILSGILAGIPSPVVAELGAGYGKLAYFVLRDLDTFTYLDFDLPETLCLAAYYLMNVWPDKKVLLYGEDDFSADSFAKYDLIFMPPQEIEPLGRDSVDLFLNKNSLGEMARESVTNYVQHIGEATRFFFHMNHDVYPRSLADGHGLLGCEYPVPANQFRTLFRYPDIGHLLMEGYLEMRNDIFFYLYEKRA
jgi:hypothetical protein